MIEYDTFKDEYGRTRRDVAEMLGEEDKLPPPVELTYDDHKRLDLFFSISRLRKPSDSGIMPLGESITVWQELMKVQLDELDIQLILELDQQYRTSMAKELEKQSKASDKSANKEYDL